MQLHLPLCKHWTVRIKFKPVSFSFLCSGEGGRSYSDTVTRTSKIKACDWNGDWWGECHVRNVPERLTRIFFNHGNSNNLQHLPENLSLYVFLKLHVTTLLLVSGWLFVTETGQCNNQPVDWPQAAATSLNWSVFIGLTTLVSGLAPQVYTINS